MSRTPELVVGDAVGDARRTAVVVVPEWLGLPTEPPERAWRIEARGGALLLMAPGGSVFLIEAPDAPRAEPASCVDEHVGLTPFGRRTTPAERAARALFDSLGAARRRRLALLLALLSEHRAADATPPGPLSALAAGTTSTRATDRAAPDAFLRFGATAADLADASGGGWEAILDPTARAHGDAAALARAIVANAALGRGAEAADAVVALCGRRPHLVDLCTDALLALHYPERASAMIAGLAAPAGGADHAWRARASAAMRVGDVALATLLSETHLGGRSIAGDERAAPPEPVADPDKPADRDAVTRTQSDIWSATPAEVCARLLALEDRFPGSELLHTYCGEIHLWTGDYGAAAVEFERALALYARSRWAHVGLACVHMLTGNFGDADRLLERVDRLVEPSPLATTHGITGELRRRQGEPRAAIEQLLVAVGAKPSRFAAWLNLALCYAEVGELDRASEALATFCSLAPALVWTATRGATATLERADIVTHADALFATMRGNRSSGYVTYFATDGVFCVAEPGLRAARHIASGLAADFRRDPGFILEDCRRWAPLVRRTREP